MKKLFIYISVMVLSVLGLSGCEQSPADMLVGKFNVTDITTDNKMDEETRAVYNEQMEIFKQNSWHEFHKDKTLKSSTNDNVMIGSWELLGGDKQLKFVYEDMSTVLVEIVSLDANQLVTKEFDSQTGSSTFITYTKE